MAKNPKFSDTTANAKAVAATALLNNGYLRIYDGSQPANANAGIGGATLLAELRFNATAFGAPSAGVAVANAITSDTDANATGTAAWFRALESDGTTVVFDGSIGAGGTFDLVLNTTSIVIHAEVAVSSFTYTENEG
jgi:hypothetical protein